MFSELKPDISIFLLTQGSDGCKISNKSSSLKHGEGGSPNFSSVDYSDMSNWLSNGGDKSKEVDAFVVYPTVAFSNEKADLPFVRLNSALMRKHAEDWLISIEGILTPTTNIYLPLYSQLNAVMLSRLDKEELADYTSSIPRNDIFAAFDYYLTNKNKGRRPFIIFGHSQGAHLVIELATTFLGNKKYFRHNENFIAAYAIGCSVNETNIVKNPSIKFSERKDDTGVIVSWNTTAPSEVSSGAVENFVTSGHGALVTNPITWRTDETPVPASENSASAVTMFDGSVKMVNNYADAKVDKKHGVLIVTSVDESHVNSMSPNIGKFHQFDITFYYDSIKQNIMDRVKAFISN